MPVLWISPGSALVEELPPEAPSGDRTVLTQLLFTGMPHLGCREVNLQRCCDTLFAKQRL